MALPHPRINIDARKLFNMLYQNEMVDLDAARKTLDDQLKLYLERLSIHLRKRFSQKDEQRILEIIQRNNEVAKVLKSPQFMATAQKMRSFLKGVSLGLIFCIDGRIPAVFIGGRFANHWEIPAGELKVVKRKSDNHIIPESSELSEALRLIVNRNKELLEVVFAHTSLLNPFHGCGAMAAKKAKGLVPQNVQLEEANLKIIDEATIPSIENLYNEFRIHQGLEPLKRVGISALYDTDTFGVLLNYGKRESGGMLSTTDIADEYKDLMDAEFAKYNLVFGAFRERFSSLAHLPLFSENILKVVYAVFEKGEFKRLREGMDDYINTHYPDLTQIQKQALKFFLVRTVALQYLTGSCSITKKTLHHPFAHHEEKYMAVSTRGTTIGKFDPHDQGFSSTPADVLNAVQNIKSKLSIMCSSRKKSEPYLLFICNPVNKRDLKENSIQLHKVMDANAELLRAVISDKELWEMIKKEELIPVSVLIDEDNREVLKIIDHSAYI